MTLVVTSRPSTSALESWQLPPMLTSITITITFENLRHYQHLCTPFPVGKRREVRGGEGRGEGGGGEGRSDVACIDRVLRALTHVLISFCAVWQAAGTWEGKPIMTPDGRPEMLNGRVSYLASVCVGFDTYSVHTEPHRALSLIIEYEKYLTNVKTVCTTAKEKCSLSVLCIFFYVTPIHTRCLCFNWFISICNEPGSPSILINPCGHTWNTHLLFLLGPVPQQNKPASRDLLCRTHYLVIWDTINRSHQRLTVDLSDTHSHGIVCG